MIAIIDYGLGNLGSISNMLNYLGLDNIITSDISQLQNADKLILPGVGSFDEGMKNLKKMGLDILLKQLVIIDKKPLLGICLGMQLLGYSSEEGDEEGLKFVNFKCLKFRSDVALSIRVPHMGWANIYVKKNCPIANGIGDDFRYYFVNSYYAKCEDSTDILFESFYGNKFTSGINKENIYGVQFHPEKSRNYGMKLLENFAKLNAGENNDDKA